MHDKVFSSEFLFRVFRLLNQIYQNGLKKAVAHNECFPYEKSETLVTPHSSRDLTTPHSF